MSIRTPTMARDRGSRTHDPFVVDRVPCLRVRYHRPYDTRTPVVYKYRDLRSLRCVFAEAAHLVLWPPHGFPPPPPAYRHPAGSTCVAPPPQPGGQWRPWASVSNAVRRHAKCATPAPTPVGEGTVPPPHMSIACPVLVPEHDGPSPKPSPHRYGPTTTAPTPTSVSNKSSEDGIWSDDASTPRVVALTLAAPGGTTPGVGTPTPPATTTPSAACGSQRREARVSRTSAQSRADVSLPTTPQASRVAVSWAAVVKCVPATPPSQIHPGASQSTAKSPPSHLPDEASSPGGVAVSVVGGASSLGPVSPSPLFPPDLLDETSSTASTSTEDSSTDGADSECDERVGPAQPVCARASTPATTPGPRYKRTARPVVRREAPAPPQQQPLKYFALIQRPEPIWVLLPSHMDCTRKLLGTVILFGIDRGAEAETVVAVVQGAPRRDEVRVTKWLCNRAAADTQLPNTSSVGTFLRCLGKEELKVHNERLRENKAGLLAAVKHVVRVAGEGDPSYDGIDVSNVWMRYDREKLTVWYTAPVKVQVSFLARKLFYRFRCRIWMRQKNYRAVAEEEAEEEECW